MEASGHYYTVYFVSLAVGFDDDVAREFAFYAQLPDQLDKLDAADLELKYLLETKAIRLRSTVKALQFKPVPLPISAPGYQPYVPIPSIGPTEDGLKAKQELNTENYWRVLIERTLHALTGKNAKEEQNKTVEALRKTYSENFSYAKFGFLLHRLGDTFAHTRFNGELDEYHFEPENSRVNEMLYRADFHETGEHGHGLDGTHPDHPWQRKTLFMNYLGKLYEVLYDLCVNEQKSPFPKATCNKAYSFTEVKAVFENAIRASSKSYREGIDSLSKVDRQQYKRFQPSSGLNDNIKALELNAQANFKLNLFLEIIGNTNIKNPSTYSPEKDELMTYTELKKKYPNIPSFEKIEKYINEIQKETATSMEK